MQTTDLRTHVDDLETELRAMGTRERAEFERGYLKSSLDFLGAKVPATRRAARGLVRRLDLDERDQLLGLADELWGRRIHELRVAATEVLRSRVERLGPPDLARIEEYIRESRTWALVDNLAVHVVGPLTRDPAIADRYLDAWSHDSDFWLRRSALLAPLLDLRRGAGDLDRFARYADRMLEEKEFFIRKAIGWVLREISKQRPDWVAEWLGERIDRVSGLTLREGAKRLPSGQRQGLRADFAQR